MQADFDEKSLTRFKAIQKATNRANDLTKQLLGFSRGKSQLSEIADINHLIREMDSIIAETVPVVPLYYGQAIKFLQKDVKGLPSNAINILDLRRVRKVVE